MTDRPKDCQVYQERDGSHYCGRCGLRWDMDDDAPECRTDSEVMNNNLRRAGKMFSDAMPTVKQAADNLNKAFRTMTEQAEINRRGIAKLRECLKDE